MERETDLDLWHTSQNKGGQKKNSISVKMVAKGNEEQRKEPTSETEELRENRAVKNANANAECKMGREYIKGGLIK